MTDTNALLIWLVGGAVSVLALLALWVVARGRPIAGEHVFRASRWSRGNRLFPTQVAITPGERDALHAAVVRAAGTVDPHGARGVGGNRHEPVLLERRDRNQRRIGTGAMPRPQKA